MGRARSFDLPAYSAARTHALAVLSSALRAGEHSELFKITETYRAGAEGRDKTDRLLRALYSLLQDITFLHSGTPELVRNTDILGELKKLAEASNFEWIRVRRRRSGRGRTRHAAKSAAVAGTGLVRDRPGTVGLELRSFEPRATATRRMKRKFYERGMAF